MTEESSRIQLHFEYHFSFTNILAETLSWCASWSSEVTDTMKWSKYPTLGGDQDTLIDVSSTKYAARFSTGSGAKNRIYEVLMIKISSRLPTLARVATS